MSPHDEWRARKRDVALANGVRLAYVDIGEASLPPLLLIHGFTDSSRTWSGITDALPGYRLIMPDLRGHGDSSAPEDGYTSAHFADDMRQLLDTLGITQCPIIGHSLGGMIAQTFAAGFPDRVEKLILIGTSAAPANKVTLDLSAEIDSLQPPIDPESPFMLQWYANPGQVDETFLATLRREAARIPIHVLKQTMNAVRSTSLLGDTQNITAPTLLIWGDADPFFGGNEQQEMRDAIANCSIAVLPGMGHNPFWEEPQQLAEMMLAFLAREDA